MIVNSAALSLSAFDENLPIIGWHNIVTVSNVVTTTEESGFPITNVANHSTFLKWKGGINTGTELVVVTTGFAGLMDYVAIAKHNFGSAGIEVSLSSGASPQLIAPFIPDDDCPLILRFDPQVVGTLQLTLNPVDVAPEMAVLYAGKLLVVERSIKVDVDHTPINLGRKLKVFNGMSESGNFLGRIVLHQFNESKAEFSHITPDWYRANFDPFVLASQESPFFWAWNPEEQPDDVGYAWLTADPEPAVAPVTRRMSVDLEMRGITCV